MASKSSTVNGERGFTGIYGSSDREVNGTPRVIYVVSCDFGELIPQRLMDHLEQQWSFLTKEEKMASKSFTVNDDKYHHLLFPSTL